VRLSPSILLQQVDYDLVALLDESTGQEIVMDKATLGYLKMGAEYFLNAPTDSGESG